MMKQKSKHLLLILVIYIAVSCTKTPDVAKIGLVGPFTGRHRAIGYDVIYSARLAIRESNERGGIGNSRVALVALDDFGDPEIAKENATAVSLDPDIVAVVGHWLPQINMKVEQIYKGYGLPHVVTGEQPFGPQDPNLLPTEFRQDYTDSTPFDEIPGPYAGSGYDAIQLVIAAMELAASDGGSIERQRVGEALESLSINGLTGEIYSN